jgi:hypothetical protein
MPAKATCQGRNPLPAACRSVGERLLDLHLPPLGDVRDFGACLFQLGEGMLDPRLPLPGDVPDFEGCLFQFWARSGQRSLITNLVLPALSSLDITFAGLTVSDAKFALATSFGGSTFNPATGPWFKPDNNTAHLLITFDLTAVPELTSLVLLASGLLRLGLIGRRKRAAHAA